MNVEKDSLELVNMIIKLFMQNTDYNLFISKKL